MKQNKRFNSVSKIALLAVYILVLVGGIVRSTGSGMGCPDWPKCFGSYVPPTDVRELPADYKEIYAAKRNKKNIRFAKLLTGLGFEDLANQLLNDESVLVEEDFNKYKTWTEYVNRLVGVAIGILVILVLFRALQLGAEHRNIKFLAFFNLLLVVFQGWLGAIVVSTNLMPWMVTVHMLPALIIVALLVYFDFISARGNIGQMGWKYDQSLLNSLVLAGIVLLLVQIVLGTQVREGVDQVAENMNQLRRSEWVELVGMKFYVHRSFSLLLLLIYGAIYLYVKRLENSAVMKFVTRLLLLVGVTIVTGMVLAYLGLPALAQPLHLLFAIISFGFLVRILFELNRKRVI